MRVVLATDDGEIARQVTPWTAGFAVGEASLIVLFPSRSPSYPHDTLEDVLRHEVAHVLISRAASGRPVPRWFHEGLAVAVERPWGLEDRSRLASTLLFGPRLTLDGIDSLFTGEQEMQARGYSLSAAVVRYLISEHGAAAPAEILRRMSAGWTFDEAAASVTQRSIPYFESGFWDQSANLDDVDPPARVQHRRVAGGDRSCRARGPQAPTSGGRPASALGGGGGRDARAGARTTEP